MTKTTKELENEFSHVNTEDELKKFLKTNNIGRKTFGDRLQELCDQYKVSKSDIISRVNISKSHIYAVQSGGRNAKRDRVIKIAVAIGVTVEEANELLKLAGHKELYVKNQADNIILYGLKMKKSVGEIEELLKEYKCKLSLLDKE